RAAAGISWQCRPAAADSVMRNKSLPVTAGGPASVPVDRNNQGAGESVEAQVEPGHCGGGVGVDAERGGGQRVHREYVPVRRVALRGRGAAEVLGPVVVADREGPGRQAAAVRRSGIGRQLGHRRRDVYHDPVPEAASGGGVRVVTGHGEALGFGRESVPAKVGRYVLAGHAEAVVYLVITHVMVMGDIIAFDGERWHLRHEVVGQG